MFSKQVSQGSRLWFWKTTARSGPGPAISRPSQSSTPSVGRVSPAIRFKRVDLPQPEWPIRAMNSPCAILRSISRSATNLPFFVVKVWPTFSMLTNFSMTISLRRFLGQLLGQQDQRLLEDQADDADDEDGDDDVLDLQVVPLVPDPEADADAAGQHFCGDDDQPGGTDGQADTGEHVGQHGREEDLGDDLPFRQCQHAGNVQVILRHTLHALSGIHDHRPERADEDGV